ncbi:MAG: RluA family pseudouridine synthase [Clostridia bacterium]|nr:RluA family pseudouridine synthase [Clostridia bacterium]
MKIDFYVPAEFDGRELRNILENYCHMSHALIKKIKLYGELDVNGVHRRVIDTAKEGDYVFASYGDDCGEVKKDSGIKIYFEDEHIVVVEKPNNLVTHPTHNHLDDSLTTRLSDTPMHPVMRLDRETTGIICIAKNGYAHDLVQKSKMDKKYLAVVYGRFDNLSGTINLPIRRRPNSVMIRECADDGHPSITHYKVLHYDSENNISLVKYILETGRCHQIRVHSTHIGHPLVGDGLYGPNSIDNPCDKFDNSKILDSKIGRQALHAYYLDFIHPDTQKTMVFNSPLPEDMLSLFSKESQKAVNELSGEL